MSGIRGCLRKVVDSNALRSPDLQQFLAERPTNIAVVSDYVGVEIHKKDPLITLPESMRVLCQFPRQVLVLKGTSILCGMSGRSARLQQRLIDARGTKEFPRYCQVLRSVGNPPEI